MLSTISPYLTWVLGIPTSLKALGMTLFSIAGYVNLGATVNDSLAAKKGCRIGGIMGAILEKINASGVGPQGLGGKITSLSCHIEYFPCHLASLPVAVNINCHAARHAEVEL